MVKPPTDSLQVILIAHADGANAGGFPRPRDYVKTIENAFVRSETNEIVRDLALVDDRGTGASVRSFFICGKDATAPIPLGRDQLDKALHTLVLVFVTRSLVNDGPIMQILEEISLAVKNSDKRHDIVILGTSEEVLKEFRERPEAITLKPRQGWSVEKLGEYAQRPTYAAIMALHRAHRLLVTDRMHPSAGGRVRFFVSHSKLDGLPLAHSLKHTIGNIPGLDTFYDAEDIQAGEDFEEVLEQGILNSMVLILRTDIYDLRFWCRQEVMWAESYDRPALLVDARTELIHRPSVLGFTGIPCVRIPDGNLIRILLEALREWVRIAVLQRRFRAAVSPGSEEDKRTELLSRAPSLTALAEAINRLVEKGAQPNAEVTIVHPDPALETNHLKAVQAFISSSFEKGQVLSSTAFFALLP